MESLIKNDESRHIKSAIDRAIQNYIESRRQKIPEFVQTHFSVSGAVKINRKALGLDLVKAPLNVAWMLPYTAVRATSLIFRKIGLKKVDLLAKKIPTGFKTAVQEEINRLISSKSKQEGFRQALEKRLEEYSVSRVAVFFRWELQKKVFSF